MPLMNHPIAFARTACSASSLRRYVAVSAAVAAAQPKTKPLIHSVSRRFSRLLFACVPLVLGAAALVPATPAQAQVVNICDRTAQVETAILAALSHSDCSAVTSAELAGISGDLSLRGQGIASLQASDFSGLSGLTYLYLYDNALTSLPEGVFSGLGSLRELHLDFNTLTSLPEGVFSGLSSLTHLRLNNNALTSLPEGMLSGLGSLTHLHLDSNGLTSLPEGVFSGLSSLTHLRLNNNQLSSLPDAIFNSPGNLTYLDLNGNSGAPFTVTFSLIAGDFNTVRVQMAAGSWTTLEVPLTASNGTLSVSSVTIPKGATLSNAATFTPDSDPNTVSTVSIGTVPSLPESFTGLTLAKGSSLTMIQGGICNRSPKVRAYILNALSGVSDCGAVTPTHLASLTGTLMLSAQGATNCKLAISLVSRGSPGWILPITASPVCRKACSATWRR